jgi:hypothetical protein
LNSAYQEITQSLSLSQDKLAAQSARVFSLLVKYVADFALLVRTVKGSDLTRQEEETYKLLKEVLKAYEITGNGGRMEGKLAEFWACILRLKQVVDSGYASNGKFDWSLESEQDLLRVSIKVLSSTADSRCPEVESRLSECRSSRSKARRSPLCGMSRKTRSLTSTL